METIESIARELEAKVNQLREENAKLKEALKETNDQLLSFKISDAAKWGASPEQINYFIKEDSLLNKIKLLTH